MKARFSTEARNDLQEIADYIAADSPRRARSFTRELRTRATEIARNPQAYPLVEGQSHRGIRRRVHGAYLILYRMSGGRLDILRIVHGARDYPKLLDDSAGDLMLRSKRRPLVPHPVPLQLGNPEILT